MLYECGTVELERFGHKAYTFFSLEFVLLLTL